MIITPDQIAMLRSPEKVRGALSGTILYGVGVSQQAYSRVCALTAICAIPETLVWYTAGSTTNRFELHTNQPEFFIELEQRIDDARRQR